MLSLLFGSLQFESASLASPVLIDSIPVSSASEAIAFLNSVKKLDSSKFWPNIDPVLLIQNLNSSIRGPLKSFAGRNTNFCSYAALSFVPLKNDPLGFSRFIIQLYNNGYGRMGRTMIRPGKEVRKVAGLLRYKGELDINHLAQLWFLSLADHFKGYLNFFNKGFDEGDENTLWAATNYAKFNRMLQKLFIYKVKARGSDLFKPQIDDIYEYLQAKLQRGTLFLYLNNRLLYKKNHESSRFGIPTHYVVLTNIWKEGEQITIIYWDAGRKTLQQVSASLLKKILFGISYCASP